MSYSTEIVHGVLHAANNILHPVTRAAGQSANIISGNELPPVEALVHLGITGMADELSVQNALQRHGVTLTVAGDPQGGSSIAAQSWITDLWNQYYFSQQEMPTAHEDFTLANRGIISDQQLDRRLERLGFYSQNVRAGFSNLRYEIPSSSDLVRFSVRHVFEPDLIKRLGYNDEFRPVLDVWHKFQGLNYPIFSGPFKQSINTWEVQHGFQPNTFLDQYVAQGLEDPTWAQAFWWSHWVLPSAGQGYEMYFRLRPDRDRRFDPDFAKDLNFTLDDLNLLLRANDYPPAYRAALAAIAHRVPGIRFMRELLRANVYGPAQVYDLLRRQGYSDGDAQSLVTALSKTDRDTRRRAIEQQARSTFARYYEAGIINAGDYQSYLVQHGLSGDEAAQAVQLAGVDLAFERAKKVIAFVHRKYIKGGLTNAQALTMLHNAGVLEPRASEYISDWAIEVESKHREISASQAIKLACQGLITLADLTTRLTNLHYGPEDVQVLAAEAVQCVAEKQAKLALQAQRTEKQRQADIIRAQKAAAAQVRALRQALSAHGTPKQLADWYCANLIGQAEVYQRLEFLGWPDVDIARLLANCKRPSGGVGAGTGGNRGPTSP